MHSNKVNVRDGGNSLGIDKLVAFWGFLGFRWKGIKKYQQKELLSNLRLWLHTWTSELKYNCYIEDLTWVVSWDQQFLN